jgi:predicted SAM-dependent methyltransferase
MKLTEEQIREIAENLDMGMRCFCHLKTGEIEVTPDFLDGDWIGQDTEPWQETLDKLDENRGDYFEFEKMTSHESFEIMADFAEIVDNKKLQDLLYRALNKSKPFRNFKWEIDNAGIYRQKWFDYKNQGLFEFVKTQIEQHNRKFADE